MQTRFGPSDVNDPVTDYMYYMPLLKDELLKTTFYKLSQMVTLAGEAPTILVEQMERLHALYGFLQEAFGHSRAHPDDISGVRWVYRKLVNPEIPPEQLREFSAAILIDAVDHTMDPEAWYEQVHILIHAVHALIGDGKGR